MIALGTAVLALGGGGAYMLAQQANDSVEVIAISNNVARGEVIEAGDLTIAAASPDPALNPVPAARMDEIVGQRAAADLTAGTLLSQDAVTDVIIPAAGQTVVGVALLPPQLPTEQIIPGDQVRVFDTTNPGDEPPRETPSAIAATVVSVSDVTDTGHIIVNVLVERDVAGDLIARVATGRVGLALDSIEDGADR
ncbi:SAF domain-containing protein [Jiangella rhizosphaerae]|uniref:SAF domain-containing protein n=1 Tax=Jiangella rhizosphaerae TaxID=2293569 RepID=A0A418KHX5_9ACTN|nr:SAF domain-containing protein [Jiangella rhizosphaerae]RIQ12220.1 hypothetical protein DY240_27390 [Jiangella rhizosphaerae]